MRAMKVEVSHAREESKVSTHDMKLPIGDAWKLQVAADIGLSGLCLYLVHLPGRRMFCSPTSQNVLPVAFWTSCRDVDKVNTWQSCTDWQQCTAAPAPRDDLSLINAVGSEEPNKYTGYALH